MIKKALIYFLIITACLYALRYLHYQGLLKQNEGYYAKFKTAFFEKNNFNVLFLGSSRVGMHYNTKLFDSLTHSNSFDLSLAGATPPVAFAALKAYLVNSKTPEYVFYEIDYHFLKHSSTEIFEFNNYFPFLSNKVLRTQFNNIDHRINHFYYNPYFSFPYTGFKNLSTGIHGWFNVPNANDKLYYKGFITLTDDKNLNYASIKPYFSFISITNRNYLDSIIILSKQINTKLIFVSSPLFAGGMVDLVNKKQVISQLNNIAKINHIKYYNLSSLPFCDQRNLFKDHYHMNYFGATKFTLDFSHLFNNKIASNALK